MASDMNLTRSLRWILLESTVNGAEGNRTRTETGRTSPDQRLGERARVGQQEKYLHQ